MNLFERKGIYDTYEAVFTLNCFNRESKHPEYAIEKLPIEYGRELRENADWLKIFFHAQKFDVVKNDMEQIIKWAHAKKIVFGFAQDVI